MRDAENARTLSEFKLTARRVLELATIEGARSLGIDDRVGSLRPGKRADIIAVTTRALNMGGFADAAHLLVGSALPENVDTVVIDGRILKRQHLFARPTTPHGCTGIVERSALPGRCVNCPGLDGGLGGWVYATSLDCGCSR